MTAEKNNDIWEFSERKLRHRIFKVLRIYLWVYNESKIKFLVRKILNAPRYL